MTQRHDRLPRLAEAHVVGEDGAAASQEKRNAFHLVREESIGERRRLAPGVVEVVWRAAQQLRERRSLGVEGGVRVDRDRVLLVHRVSFR